METAASLVDYRLSCLNRQFFFRLTESFKTRDGVSKSLMSATNSGVSVGPQERKTSKASQECGHESLSQC